MRPVARCKDMREAVHYRRGTYTHKCRRLLVLWCLLTVIAPGCGDDGEGSASDDPNAFTTDAPVLDEIQASIGTEGGVLEGLSDSLLAGVRLQIPAGALMEETRIVIRPVLDGTPMPVLAQRVGPQFAIEPAGTLLVGRAVLTLPLDVEQVVRVGAQPDDSDVWTRNEDSWTRLDAVDVDDQSVTVEIAELNTMAAGVLLVVKPPQCVSQGNCAEPCASSSNGFCIDRLGAPTPAPDTAVRFLAEGGQSGTVEIHYVSIESNGRRAVRLSTGGETTSTSASQPMANLTRTPLNPQVDSDGSVWAGFESQGNVRFRFGTGTTSQRYDSSNLSERGNALGVIVPFDGSFVRVMAKGAIRRSGGVFQPFVDWGVLTRISIEPFFVPDPGRDRRILAKETGGEFVALDTVDGSRAPGKYFIDRPGPVLAIDLSLARSLPLALLQYNTDTSTNQVSFLTEASPSLLVISADPIIRTVSYDSTGNLWLAAADSAEVYRFTIDGFLLGVTLTPATAGTTEYNCALPRQIVGLTGRAVAVLTNCGEFLRVRPVS